VCREDFRFTVAAFSYELPPFPVPYSALIIPHAIGGAQTPGARARSIGFSRLGLCKYEGAATGGQSAFSQTIHLRQGYG